ncbi:MAG: tetratricopeptide repeat protein [Magnetococcales bacterium]|nr:tetratricopeptide repeat protein [Magnetococcales bacterium]
MGKADPSNSSYNGQKQISVDEAYKKALNYFNAEQFTEADKLCTAIIQAVPHHIFAINLLGLIAQKLNLHDLSLELFQRVVEIDKSKPWIYYNIGTALNKLGRFNEAIEAQKKAVSIDPNYAEAHNSLGNVLIEQGSFAEAVNSLQKAIDINPEYADAYYNLGVALQKLGKTELAIIYYQKLIEFKPDNANAFLNLSIALEEQGKLNEAVTSAKSAISIDNKYTEPYIQIGNILKEQKKLDEALIYYQKAININPEYAEAYNNIGTILKKQNRISEAISNFQKATILKPNFADAFFNLGVLQIKQDKIEDAIKNYKKALSIKPEYFKAHCNLIFCLDLLIKISSQEAMIERKNLAAQHTEHLKAFWLSFPNKPDHNRVLRIGYVGADFIDHSAAHIFGTMLLNYNKRQFKVFCYAGNAQEDDLSEQFKQNSSKWLSTTNIDDATLAEIIQKDSIDILVDLSGHTDGNRLLTFARKPAPIQITAWGYPHGTAMDAMDYLFADPYFFNSQERRKLKEKVIDLPCVIHLLDIIPFPKVTDPPVCKSEYITFGAFNRLEKNNSEVYALWAKILHSVPTAKLFIKTSNLDDITNINKIETIFQEKGISRQRLNFMGKTTPIYHREIHSKIDIMLDTFPHNGGMTTLSSLKMGVPVLTHEQKTQCPTSASILYLLGLDEWCAQNDDEYVEKAVKFANEINYLKTLRHQLRKQFDESVLGNSKLYTQEVENIYRQLWIKWCDSRK